MLGAKQQVARFMADERLIYSSENGDRWFLVHGVGMAPSFVRHQANIAAGGTVTDMEIDVFLGAGQVGPEQVALRRLLGKESGA